MYVCVRVRACVCKYVSVCQTSVLESKVSTNTNNETYIHQYCCAASADERCMTMTITLQLDTAEDVLQTSPDDYGM